MAGWEMEMATEPSRQQPARHAEPRREKLLSYFHDGCVTVTKHVFEDYIHILCTAKI